MAHPGFGHLWQQAELSDAEIMLSAYTKAHSEGDEACEVQSSSQTVLQQFPGHSPILSSSPYFAAQVSKHQYTLQHSGCIPPGQLWFCFHDVGVQLYIQ
jgi:hypothetical protein